LRLKRISNRSKRVSGRKQKWLLEGKEDGQQEKSEKGGTGGREKTASYI